MLSGMRDGFSSKRYCEGGGTHQTSHHARPRAHHREARDLRGGRRRGGRHPRRVGIAGEDLFALNEDGRARLRGQMVGFVFQSFELLPALTALENAMLPLELAGGADAAGRARRVLDRVGLAERLGHYPRQLSGGEQQRVAVARAFVTEPRLLFADEPTGNLDSETGEHVIDLLFEMNRERGTTLVLVTHDVELAKRCDRRLHIAAGEITHED